MDAMVSGEGVRGYAHVIKEDTVGGSALSGAHSFGSLDFSDGGNNARYRARIPMVAVRTSSCITRVDLVIATHGPRHLDVDDITPLRPD